MGSPRSPGAARTTAPRPDELGDAGQQGGHGVGQGDAATRIGGRKRHDGLRDARGWAYGEFIGAGGQGPWGVTEGLLSTSWLAEQRALWARRLDQLDAMLLTQTEPPDDPAL